MGSRPRSAGDGADQVCELAVVLCQPRAERADELCLEGVVRGPPDVRVPPTRPCAAGIDELALIEFAAIEEACRTAATPDQISSWPLLCRLQRRCGGAIDRLHQHVGTVLADEAIEGARLRAARTGATESAAEVAGVDRTKPCDLRGRQVGKADLVPDQIGGQRARPPSLLP